MRTAHQRRLGRKLVALHDGVRLGKVDERERAALDEIVVLARSVGEARLAVALSVQATYRWHFHDLQGAVHAAEEAIGLLVPLAAGQPGRFGPDLLRARYLLAVAHADLGRAADAVPALERYVRMLRLAPVDPEPNRSTALRLLVDGYRRLGRPADAVPHAEVLVRVARASASRPRISGADRFDLAKALCVESDCRLLAGLPAAETAVEAVADICRGVAFQVNGATQALLRALGVLYDALGSEPDAELAEIRQWCAAQLPTSDFREWLEKAKTEHQNLARLLELSMRPLVACGRADDARLAGTEAVRLFRYLAEEKPRCAAGAVRVQRALEQLQ